MTVKKPSESEEEYFAREEALRKHKLVVEKTRQMADAEREALKNLHHGHCPNCGTKLERVTFQGVQIDRCFNCQGTWLDAGELEHLVGKEPGFLQRVAAVFKRD